MTTVKIQADIDAKGFLRLDVPVGLPAGRAEVVVVIESDAGDARDDAPLQTRTARSGLFDAVSTEIDVDVALMDMNDAWKSKLSGLP